MPGRPRHVDATNRSVLGLAPLSQDFLPRSTLARGLQLLHAIPPARHAAKPQEPDRQERQQIKQEVPFSETHRSRFHPRKFFSAALRTIAAPGGLARTRRDRTQPRALYSSWPAVSSRGRGVNHFGKSSALRLNPDLDLQIVRNRCCPAADPPTRRKFRCPHPDASTEK